MRRIIFFSIIIFASLSSCKKETYNAGKTNSEKMSNNWWCTFTINNQDIGIGHFLLTTYNTADDKDSIWIDDLKNSWQFKCKAKADLSNSTFETSNSQNQYYDITVKIDDGKILSKAGHSKSGVITDSIYMKATFSDDPTNTYIISGVARTGLIEDDY